MIISGMGPEDDGLEYADEWLCKPSNSVPSRVGLNLPWRRHVPDGRVSLPTIRAHCRTEA